MPSFILRKIDPALWSAFLAKVQDAGQQPKAVLLQLIAEYVKGKE